MAYDTDQEQIEMLKKWWDDYGKALLVAIIIGLLAGFGWRYWNQYKLDRAEHASMIYQAMTVASGEGNFQVADQYAAQLNKKYSTTPYASMANFLAAKEAVQKKQLPAALKRLNWVIKHSSMDSFKQLARIRAARILLATRQPKEALATLAIVNSKHYQAMIDSLQGDIYSALKDTVKAKAAYQASKNSYAAAGIIDPLLNMKLAR